MLRLTLAACLLATPVLADPEYYRVVGVASDDTLNVRARADARSDDVGDIPHDARGIEVLGRQGNWGRILWQGGDGWIAMRFVQPDAVARLGGTALPVGLLCSGTEPFWSIRMSQANATFSDPGGAVQNMQLRDGRVADGRPAFPVALRFGSESASALSLIRAQDCSDGMSDQTYGYAISQLVATAAGEQFLEGCCALPLEVGSN